MRSLVVGILLITLWQTEAGAQASMLDDPAARERAKAGLDAMYDLQFAVAADHFAAVRAQYPDHPVGPFLEALRLWWTILLDLSDTSHDERFFEAMTAVIDRCNATLERDPEDLDALFFKGVALGFRGRLRSNRRDWLRSAADGKRAMDYVLAVARADTTNPDYAFGRGIYDYYAALIPERYPFARAITTFLPKGDRQRGLALLNRTATQGYFLKAEATYFLVQINLLYEKDFAATVRGINWLRRHYPQNAFFHTLEGRIYAHWHHWQRVDTVFTDVLARYRDRATGYTAAAAEQALYYLARSRLEAGAPMAAIGYLLPLEALSARLDGDTYFKTMGRLRLGMAYDLTGQREHAVARYDQVLSMVNWGSSHAWARRYLRSPYAG